MKNMLFVPLVLASFAVAEAPARADVKVFNFTGICSDCAGTVKAELTLQNYTQGTDLTPANFVSFHYDGSNLWNAFSVTQSEGYAMGVIPSSLPSAAQVTLNYRFWPYNFDTSLDGQWFLGNLNPDQGISGVWSLGSAVPEPSTWAMMLAGFVGLGFLGYRRGKSADLAT